jgi:hypothetical protein
MILLRMNKKKLITGLKYPNSKREHTEFWVMRERHGSRAWLVDIRHNGHTCVMEHCSCYNQYKY